MEIFERTRAIYITGYIVELSHNCCRHGNARIVRWLPVSLVGWVGLLSLCSLPFLRGWMTSFKLQELCSMDNAEVCHCQLYEMTFAASLAPEMSYSYLYRFSHIGNLLVTVSRSRDRKPRAMLVNMH